MAATKFVAAFFTGSSAMMSEGFHSLVDTGNEALLLYAEHRAELPPDRAHPFGFGREIYFWSFVVAILLFAAGAAVSVYEGVDHLIHRAEIRDPLVNYVVLAISAVFEATSWTIALRTFNRTKGDLGYGEAIRRSKDPPSFIVLLEDTAALIGIAIAAAGTAATTLFHRPEFDGAASIAIGVLLGCVSVLLARESKSLLIGEAALPRVVEAVRAAAAKESILATVHDVWTVQLGPDAVLATLFADLDDDVRAVELENAIAQIQSTSRRDLGATIHVFVKPQTRPPAHLS